MIDISEEARSVIGRSYSYHLRVESWLGDELLASDIPVARATEETDGKLAVPERVTLTVPRMDRGVSWSPVDYGHPLGADGQLLRVQLGVGLAGNTVEWLQRGWFVIYETNTEGDTVSVEAVGLLHLVQEARLVSPYQPTGTIVSTIRGLIEPAITVEIDSELADRAVPAGINYDEDRLKAVAELLDAWNAEARVLEDGYLYVNPVTTPTGAVASLTNGAGGTIITASGGSTREGACNVVVARGTAPDGGQVLGAAYDMSGGPKSYGGNFNPLPVPEYFDSPLLTTTEQCNAAALTILKRKMRQTNRAFTVSMVPDPRIQEGDVLSITTDDHEELLCTVEALTLPYTADGGEQKLTVRTVL